MGAPANTGAAGEAAPFAQPAAATSTSRVARRRVINPNLGPGDARAVALRRPAARDEARRVVEIEVGGDDADAAVLDARDERPVGADDARRRALIGLATLAAAMKTVFSMARQSRAFSL